MIKLFNKILPTVSTLCCFSGMLLCVMLAGCATKVSKNESAETFQIAFGSCGEQDKPQPILSQVAKASPDLFIYLGDNIYGDTYSMDTLRKKYQQLEVKPEFQELKNATPILATWDDHDFGWNDSGRHYPYKVESKEIFLEFFDLTNPELKKHEGIYYSKIIENAGKRIQIILPDMRTFRDRLLPYNGNRKGISGYDYELDYSPYETSDSTMLGETQWLWIEDQLKVPADLRIIASSTQFGITHNGYEAWANFPHEQKRLTDLIRKTHANGVLFISGDVHYAEISRLKVDGLYPLYDVTASGITSTWGFATPNDNRVDGPVMENHFGMLTINWDQQTIQMEIRDVSGKARINRIVSIGELKL